MPINSKKVKTLYDALVADGADVGTEDEFNNWFFARGEQGYKNRKTVFDAFKADGADVGDNYEEFASLIGLYGKPATQQPRVQQPKQASATPIDFAPLDTRQANQRMIGRGPVPFEQPQPAGEEKIFDEGVQKRMSQRMDEIQYEQETGKRLRQPVFNPTFEAPTIVKDEYGNIRRDENGNIMTGFSTDEDIVGTHNQIKKEQEEWDKLSDAEKLAKYKQNILDSGNVDAMLEEAYKERDRIESMLAGSINDPSEQGFFDKIGQAGLGSPSTFDYRNASDYMLSNPMARDLMAAARKNREYIKMLEDVRDNQTNEFWHSFATDISDGYNFSLGGSANIDDAAALRRAQQYAESINKKRQEGKSLTREEQVAEAVLNNAMWDREVQEKYGDEYGAWARAGKMGAKSADFMLDFLMMGGAPEATARAVMNTIVKGGARLLGNAATKGFGNFMLKSLGATLGSMVAGAEITNTIQIGKTGANILESMNGDVYKDDKGNYVYGHYETDENGETKFVEGGNSFLNALAEAERSGISENGSEVLGTFLPGGSRLFEMLGLSKISKAITALQGKGWYQGYSRFLKTAGFNGIPGEGLEEYGGMVLDAMMGGEEWKNVADLRTHIDIWLGVTTMGGVLNAPNVIGTGYSAYQYQKYKKKVNIADINASSAIDPQVWQSLRETIDQTDNSQMADVAYGIMTDKNLSEEGKQAAMKYIGNLQKMRGYSLGSIAVEREQGTATANELNQSYTGGYNTQEPDLMKQYNDEAQESASNLPGYGQEFAKMVVDSQAPVETIDYLMQNRDYYTDEQIAAAADYYQKRSRAQGMMDGALDRIDLEIEKQKAQVRELTHQATGDIIDAEGADGQPYNIIGGDVVTDPDTGVTSLVGTGGAVVVRNTNTGEVSVKSPQELTISNVVPAETMIQYYDVDLSNQLMQQADDDITYGSPANETYQLEDTVALNDGNGNIIEGEIGMMPNSVDGVYVVYTPDGKALQFTADQMNRMIVAHNGQEVQRGSQQPVVQDNLTTEQQAAENAEIEGNYAQNAPENMQSGTLDNATGENAAAEDAGQKSNQPQSALSRIPVLQDEKGQPILNKKGKPQYQWHKASVEDAAAALVETTGGNMVMARDNANRLVKTAQAKLEKIRKQEPRGEDPIELAESSMAIQKQIDDTQATIKQWQDVAAAIQKQMNAESERLRQEAEAKKSEEQRKREAAEAEERKKKQDEIDRQRIREQIEKDKEKRNKEYAPLAKAKEEMKDDPDAMAILSDTEPRSLDEWVSSLLRPHSLLWQDASPTEVGLQSELGLKRSDMQRFMTLLGNKESNAEPFGKAVLDIYEALPEGMKEMYTDDDVRNTLLNLFNEGSSTRMMHLTEENRIDEARQTMLENLRRDAEAEMEAWAEANHLTPEERETYEDFLAQEMMHGAETEFINQLIEQDEQDTESKAMDSNPASRTAGREGEGGESQVQGQGASETIRAYQEKRQPEQGEKTPAGSTNVSDSDVSGGAQGIEDETFIRDLNALLNDYDTGENGYLTDNDLIERARELAEELPSKSDLSKKINEALDEYDEMQQAYRFENGMRDDDGSEAMIETLREIAATKPKEENNTDPVSGKEFKYGNEYGECKNPNKIEFEKGDYKYTIYTAYHNGMWLGAMQTTNRPRYSDGSIIHDNQTDGFKTEAEAQSYYAQLIHDRFLEREDVKKIQPILKSLQPIIDKAPAKSEYESFEDLVADTNITVTDPATKKALRKIVDKIFLHGSSNTRKDPLKFDYKFVYMASGTTKSDRALLEPWASSTLVEYDDNNPTATWVDEDEKRIYFIKYNPPGTAYSWDFVVVGYKSLPTTKQESPTEETTEKQIKRTSAPETDILVKGGTKLYTKDSIIKVIGSNINHDTETRSYKCALYDSDESYKNDERITTFKIEQQDMRQNLESGKYSSSDIRQKKEKTENKSEKKEEKQPQLPETKRLVSDDRMEELKKKLRNKLGGQATMGLDPEIVSYGVQLSIGYLERGITKLADFTKKMIQEFGEAIRPYIDNIFNKAKEQTTPKTAWWNDPNRPKSIDRWDYRTYMTDEAKEYFANFKSEDGRTDFTKWAHPNLAYITAAVWDEVEIPYEDLKNVPEIAEAEKTIKNAEANGKLEISEEEANKLAQRLIDSGEARKEQKAFVIIGLPAGGKSSVFANPLSKQYGARIIDSDDVKPWLEGFDGGNGAGYVQDASAEVAEKAIDIAVKNGDNIIIPRIGGKSVMDLSAALRLAGYDVQLYFNDVKGVTSIDRAASRFAQTGRYLSLDYLTKKAGVPSENFSKFAEKTIGGYLDERNPKEVQDIRRRVQGLRGELYGSGSGLREPLTAEREGTGEAEGTVQAALGGRELQTGRDELSLLLTSPLFNYSEWKSNDVPIGQKPKEIWNSKSGQPMPVKEEKNNGNLQSEQGLSRELGAAGEGTGKTSGSADRVGAERGPEQNRAERSGHKHSVNHKRIVSDSRMEELKKRLKAKLFGQLNVGVDPEILAIGAEMAVGYLERGVIKFADFAKTMIEEVGDFMRPYLKSFYNAVRDMPEAQEYAGEMDDYQTVSSFDVHNFDKQSKVTDAITKAQQIVDEQKVRKDVADITDGLDMKETTINDIKDETDEQTAADTAAIVSEAEAIESQARSAKSREGRTATIEKIDKQLEKIDNQLAFIGFYDVDPDAPYHESMGRMKSAEKKAVADATKVARQIAKDLGIDAKPTAKANMAPIGGDITFRIPINENTDLYFDLLMERGYDSYPDSLEMDVSYFRLEDKNTPLQDNGRYKNYVNHHFGELTPYDELLDEVRQAIRDAGIELTKPKPTKQEPKKTASKKSKQQARSEEPSLFDMMFFEEEQPTNTLGATSTPEKIEEEEAKVDTTPTEAQKEAGNYQKGHIQIDGYDITIENPKGSIRSGVDANGNAWEQVMNNTYGYIRGTEGVDGDHIDVFLSDDPTSGNVYIVDQVNPETGDFDEHKVMYGFPDAASAQVAYFKNYEQGWKGFGTMTSFSREEFKKWIESSHRKTKPAREYALAKRKQIKEQQEKVQEPEKNNNLRNNVGERGQDYAPTSPKARFNANVEAIKLMRQLIDNAVEAPTKEQMEVLRKYSGWGGMGTFFNDDSMAENKQLRELLSEEEYNDAVMSINSAYYTPASVIYTLWDVANAMGFKGGNVLEGSAGIGNIIGQMPQDMSRRSNIEAVEIDTISGNILRLLYPDATVHIDGFQDVKIPNGTVDLAITNVPFVTGLHVIDKVDKDLSRKFTNIHDFCIAKNIRKLREGGIGIFITSAGTMDKSTKLRQWIPDEGQSDVVGAFRLNNETFGGTNVTSDIIVLRKRVGGNKSENAIDISKASPLRIGSYEDKYGEEKQVSMVINDYFKDHPEMMAGEMFFGYEKGDTFRPGSYGLYPTDGKSQEKMMQDFVKQMKKVGLPAEMPEIMEQTAPKAEPNQLTAVKEGRMLVDDNGRLCVSRYGTAWPLGLNDQKVKGHTKQECFNDYQDVQKAVDDVLQQQLNDPDDAALKPKLDILNKAYDKFTKRYGTLHKNTAISFLRNDVDFPSFQALENYSETKDIKGKVKIETKKAPLFTQRVLGFKTEPQPENIKDAVIASIFRTNTIDMDWIAEKLGKSVDDVKKEILESRLGFEDPSTGQMEIRYKYLSGNVREKLAIAEGYNTDGKYAANVEELRKAVPMDIPSHLIEFSLGSSWIPIELYKDYIKESLGLSNIKLTHVEGAWVFDAGYNFNNEKNRSAGVYSDKFRETIYGHQLVAAALNNRPVKVMKQVTVGYGDSKHTETRVDQAATSACAVRVDEIKDEFKQWAKKKMQDNPELAQQIEKIYNEKFNALVPMQIDNEFLPERFDGSNVIIKLRPYQKRGAMRGLTSPTMLAHEVGTGKTFTLITTAMEMRRLGTAKKPMIVVQNSTVPQITADAKLLYPNAKVLSLTEKDRNAEGRRAFYASIKYNDWDMIIIPQSTLNMIPDSPERELQFIQEKIDEKKHVIEAAEAAGADSRQLQQMKKELDKLEQEYGDTSLDNDPANNTKKKKRNAKDEAKSLDKAETKAKEMLDRNVDDVQYFDDLGVDALLVDEAHEYKHLGFQTSIGRGIKGIDPSYSKKCAGLYNKTRAVFEKVGWKNVVFATGTPISNTAAEIWTFMKYLMQPDVMRANDIYYFDDFVHNFGNISQMLEFATSGKFKENTRFASYVNKPELIRIWTQVADIVLTSNNEELLAKIPKKEGGKDQDVFLPQSPSLVRIMTAVRAELERFENMSGKEKKENSSIPLTMFGIAKRAAIDPRLVNPDAPDEPMSKTNAAVKEILKDLKATQSYKGTVAVFCDNQNRLGKTADGKNYVEWNIYEEMRNKLIEAGVPAEQIAIIKSGMSMTAKQKVFDAVNTGDIRVVFGSTQTLGTGVNMQERLHMLIHMDAPDRPMDYTQRNGRIERQGNLHKEWGKTIRILRFGVEDSLDVTAYQRLKTKSGFIDSIMKGEESLQNNQVDRTIEEEEEGLFDNPVAVLSGSQYALKKNQAERDLRKYQGKKTQWENDQVYVTHALRRNKSEIEDSRKLIAEYKAELERYKKMFPDGKVKVVTIEGEPIDLSKGDADAYVKMIKTFKEKIQDPVNATVKKLRENPIYNDETLNYTVELDGHPINFRIDVFRTSEYENGKMKTVLHKATYYKSADLQLTSDVSDRSKSARECVEDIMQEYISGNYFNERIDTFNNKINRLNAESEQLHKRVGMEFQFSKELEEAKKHVEEYTELMKKEMEEKEAKYAAQQKEVQENGGGFDLSKAEETDDDSNLYRIDDDMPWEDDEDNPIFYSNAMQAVDSIRQDKAAPQQWLAMIVKNGGLKAGEDRWLDLSDRLNNSDKKSITKQEVKNFIRMNQIYVEETHYTEGNEILREIEKKYPGYENAFIIEEDDFTETPNYSVNDLKTAVDLYNKHHTIKIAIDNEGNITDDQYDDVISFASEAFDKVAIAYHGNTINPTRFKYTTFGLDNYREIALTVPTVEPWGQSDILHFGDAGGGRAVAWVRFGETTDSEGKRVLVIDEIQSKRHQEGRKLGYKNDSLIGKADEALKELVAFRRSLYDKYPGLSDIAYLKDYATPEEIAKERELNKKHKELERQERNQNMAPPEAPFEKNWHELAMKRMLRYAAENGYDKIAWTTGEQQGKRYSLAKKIEDFYYKKNDDGTYDISAVAIDKRNGYTDYPEFNFSNQTEKDLDNLLGKDLAQKIVEGKGRKGYTHNGTNDWTEFKGNDLELGAEGMKGFYDQILPRFMDKYGKKWGVSVKKIELPKVEKGGLIMWSVDVTPQMKESVMMGQPMFRDMEQFIEGETFPIYRGEYHSSYNVLGNRSTYSTDLMPDEYQSEYSMLDALRNQYPEYYVTIEDGRVKMQTFESVMADAMLTQTAKKAKGTESYVERKTKRAIDAVESMAKRMKLDVEVLTSTDGLTEKQQRAKGWFNKNSHKIYIVLPNHRTQSDVINTLLHEGVAHYGLRKMFGEHFDTFLDNVYNNVDPKIREAIDASIKVKGWSRHEATEEYLARLAERTEFKNAQDSGWWRKIKDFFISMLAKAGFNTILTDNELRYILWRSYDNLLHPNDRRNIFDTARDIDMQSRLKVGPYEERTTLRPTAAAEPMVTREPEVEVDETTQIINEAKANDTYMKAPNGNTTNLTEDQWVQVRTKAFKNWFGDWQNDPENASKVVDENGEPAVMYHGTNLDAANNGKPFYTFYPSSHFGTKGQAEDRADGRAKIYQVFLNIRNPQRRNDADQEYLEDHDMTMSEFWEQSVERAKGKGHDGVVYLNRYEDPENPADSWIAFNPNQIKSATDNNGEYSSENDDIRYSMRTKEPPKKTGIGYKVFVLKDGQLYPPMVANPNGEGTPVGVWLDADAAPIAGTSKTGRPQVKAGGKGTQGGSGQLAYRPGWHLGEIPYALQFNRKDENGERTLFPNNFVWAEVEYADDVDYNDEARKEGTNASGKYQHSFAGLKHVPTDGSYKYRTNPDPRTDPWIITGAMRVNKILSREEVDELVRKAGREPQPMQEGDVLTQESLDALNNEIEAMKNADEMGLLYRSDDDWDDIAKELYERAVAQNSTKWTENWQDSMVSLKAIQDAIAAETGNEATGAEDAYHFENRMHGRAKNMTEQYDWRYYRPMLKAFNKFCKQNDMTQQQGIEYLVAKSGLERNVYYAFRDAAKAKLTDEINEEREDLEKMYAKGRINEEGYKAKKQELEERERDGVDDFMKSVRETFAYQHAKDEYENGNISYTEYLRIIERVIRAEVQRKNPRRDADGNVVSDNYYDDYAKDYSGLTETFAKDVYDAAQNVKKQAQKAIDPQERKELWRAYDEQMRNAYYVAKQVADDRVFAAENNSESREKADKLWNKINAATKETLKHSYESGLIDRNNYNKVRAMFDYYIPLRGWEEDKAADVYTYMGRDNVFSPAVKKVWGRTSQAENPLAYIGNIAVSTILSGHRNQMKQHFLNYVMNNPTSLVNISESWYENIGSEDDKPVWILRTADTAGKSADEIAQIVNDFNEEMRLKQEEGKAMPVKGRLRLDLHATSGQKAEHVVEVQRAGHTYQLYINGDPKAAQALNGTAAKAVSRISDTWLGDKITNVNRNMAAFFTSKNPAFVVSNLSRDLNMAGASVAIKENAAYNAKFIENVVKVLRPRISRGSKYGLSKLVAGPRANGFTGLMPSLMRKWMAGDLNLNDDTERIFGEFMDEGGETGFVNMLSVDSFKQKMQKEIREMNGSTFFGAKANVKETTIGKGLRLLGETFEFYNRCAEDATRFIVYMTSRQMGKSLEDSIADAKDVTLNFNRKGTGGMGNAEVRDLFIFVNPAIQALANMYKMATGNTLKFGTVTAAFIAGGVLMAVMNQWMLNLFGDDDDKDAYWNLPPWVRKNNLVFWIPGTKNFVTIPLAQEFRVFYGVGEMVTSALMEHPVDRWGLEVFSSVADLVPINPTGNGGNLMVDFAPTMVQPLMQVGENVDFTGKPIWKENQGNKFAPMYTKAYITTPTWMVNVSEGINNLTGGNEGKKGVIEEYSPFWADYVNNPAVWNHLLQGYFGGMYNTIAKTFDVGVTVATGNVPKIYQTPVINRFLNRPVERDNAGVLGDDYYRLTEDRDALQYELRTWQKKAADGEEGAQEHVDEILQSEDWKRAEVITHYEKIIKDLKAGEKASNQDIDKQEIKESIALYKQEMMEELAAIDEGTDPLTVAHKKFDEAKTFAEKNKLRMRIERLQGKAGRDQKSSEDAVRKALAYREDEERESRDTNDAYLMIATAENIADDARIKAAKAEIAKYMKEYKQMMADGRTERANSYRKRNQKYFTANDIIQQQSRSMATNKKLLGMGHDAAIMKLIDQNRKQMLKVIDGLE